MSRSRVSRIDLPLSRLSSTASRRECFCTARASAYKWRARAWPANADHAGKALRAAATAASTSAAPADEQPERPPVPLQPLERLLVALGRGPIRHRLEDLRDCRHVRPLDDGAPRSIAPSRSARAA